MADNNQQQSSMVRVTGLWKTKTKAGDDMISGTVTPTCRLVILKNKNRREGKNDPEYYAFFAAVAKRENNSGGNDGDSGGDAQEEQVPF